MSILSTQPLRRLLSLTEATRRAALLIIGSLTVLSAGSFMESLRII